MHGKSVNDSFRNTIGVLALFEMVFITMLVRLSHPAMTETQLLMNFWWVWIVCGALGLIGIILTK